MDTEQIKTPGNLMFVGLMFIGIAVGLLFNEVSAGTLIGMGTGFIVRAIYGTKRKVDKEAIK
jgi:hypothetical protein